MPGQYQYVSCLFFHPPHIINVNEMTFIKRLTFEQFPLITESERENLMKEDGNSIIRVIQIGSRSLCTQSQIQTAVDFQAEAGWNKTFLFLPAILTVFWVAC